MTNLPVDVVVMGSDALSCLVAGGLAGLHGKRVCLVAEPWTPFTLARRVELSVAPATRPATWASLAVGQAETFTLLKTLGKGLTRRAEPLYVGERLDTIEWLDHMRHVASASGFLTERVQEQDVRGIGCRIRGAWQLVPELAFPAFAQWLEALGVTRLPPEQLGLAVRRDGVELLRASGDTITARQLVLADDDAILRTVDPANRERGWTSEPVTGFLVADAPAQAAPLLLLLDRNAVLQRPGRGQLRAHVAGEADVALARLGVILGEQARARLEGRQGFRRLGTLDGAPMIGIQRGAVWSVVGLPMVFAPALARQIAGVASADEQRYFAAHAPARSGTRPAVAERADQALDGLR